MKKYLFGALAICVAAGAVAFTTPKNAPTVYFSFQGDATIPTEVEDLSLWQEAAQSSGCNVDNQACQIEIDETLLNSGTNRTLQFAAPSLVLDAQDIVTVDGKYQPVYVSGPSALPVNRP